MSDDQMSDQADDLARKAQAELETQKMMDSMTKKISPDDLKNLLG